MKKFKLLKAWGAYKAGDVIEADEESQKTLTADVAVPFDPAAEAAETAKRDADTKTIQDAVASAVAGALKENKDAGEGIKIRVIRDEHEDGFKTLGDQLKWGRETQMGQGRGFDDPRFKAISQKAPSGLSEQVDADGGFLLQPQYSQELWRLAHTTGVLPSRCAKVTMGPNSNLYVWNAVDETSRANGSRWGGIQMYWTEEAGSKTASKPKFAQRSMKLVKLAALCYLTDELMEDVVAMESFVRQGFAEEMGFTLDDVILNGTGAGQPLGILNGDGKVEVSKETNQTAATVVYENVNNMWARMYARSRANAIWLVNQDVEPQLNTMKLTIGTGGVPVYMPAGGISGSPYASLFGRPVIPIEQCATRGTSGDIVLCDMSQYLLIQKGGLKTDVSIHFKYDTDQTTLRFVTRVNGQPLWRSALTPKNGSNTVAPFVTLATRG